MLKTKVIGMGAGGNSAAVELILSEVFQKKDVLLVNSTTKDIPAEFEDIAAVYSRALGGAAKERSAAKELCLDALRNDKEFSNKIDNFLEPGTQVLIFVVAAPGGTGSGSTPILARYFYQVIRNQPQFKNLRIGYFVINGFDDDIRELQNQLEFFQEINPEFTVQAISNKKFLEEGLTRKNAEKAANKAFATKLAIKIGKNINYVDSQHNMDESDLLKLSTTPGFCLCFRVSFAKLKNAEHFNKLVTEAIESDKSLDIPRPSIKRLGVITNISEKNEEFIDYKFPTLRAKLGNYQEITIHDNKYDGQEEYVEFICAGLDMPIDEIKDIYERYKQESESVVKDKDSFFDFMKDLKGNEEDSMFDIGANKKLEVFENSSNVELDKDSFFDEFEVKEDPKQSSATNFDMVEGMQVKPLDDVLETKEIKNNKNNKNNKRLKQF